MAMTPVLTGGLSTILPPSSSFPAAPAAQRLLTVVMGD